MVYREDRRAVAVRIVASLVVVEAAPQACQPALWAKGCLEPTMVGTELELMVLPAK